MDGLIFILALIPIILFLLLFAILSKTSANRESLNNIEHMIIRVNEHLEELERQVKKLKTEQAEKPIQSEAKEIPVKPVEKPKEAPLPWKKEPPPIVAEQKPVPQKEIVSPATPTDTKHEQAGTSPVLETGDAEKTPSPVYVADNGQTDWEKFIGENLANKIGIAVLVLGISFFVKFAIDKNWINETGRVAIGLVSGAILISLAHYIRNSYRSFSSVLVGGGLTVFYFTIAFAFHQYHLIGQQASFAIMVIITAFAVVLSLLYNRLELAVLATIGGFVTPFLVSTGENNYVALFTYLAILNSGLLVLSWFKKWKAINVIALCFTTIIYGSWLFRQVTDMPGQFPYRAALLFATVFYALGIAMNGINNLKLNKKFGGFDFILLLSINFLYYAAGIVILNNWDDGEYNGLFTASLGVVNFILAALLFRRKRADRNFIYLLIGLTVTFISLTGPVQLKGNQITLFWAAETVLLFWLYQRSRIVLLKVASLLLILPLMVSLFMDWSNVYSDNTTIIPVIINKGFVTTLVTAASLLIYHVLLKKEANSLYLRGLPKTTLNSILLPAGVAIAYAAGAWETYYQFATRWPGIAIYSSYLQFYTVAYMILLLFVFKKSSSFLLLKFSFTIAAMVLYLFNLRITGEISLELAGDNELAPHFIAHWASSALLAWLLFDLIIYFRRQKAIAKDYETPFTLLIVTSIVFLLSTEMYHIILWLTYGGPQIREYWNNLYYKAGLSILWGICSFCMMWLGMKHRFKTLRIISLSLFTITLVKLFIYDIQNIPPGGKIAAFILLGVLLLIVSFMYQRLKKIIIDDTQTG